jgi:hypothetical protein
MNKVKAILDSFWIGAAAFGLAGTILWVMGHEWFAGICFGVGASKFLTALKNK